LCCSMHVHVGKVHSSFSTGINMPLSIGVLCTSRAEVLAYMCGDVLTMQETAISMHGPVLPRDNPNEYNNYYSGV